LVNGVPQVTDPGLLNLNGLTNLSSLYLCNTQLSGAGLAHLKGLAKLSVIDLLGTRVAYTGLAHLEGLTKPEFFNLSKTGYRRWSERASKGIPDAEDLALSSGPAGA
jgi:hypothetical protein